MDLEDFANKTEAEESNNRLRRSSRNITNNNGGDTSSQRITRSSSSRRNVPDPAASASSSTGPKKKKTKVTKALPESLKNYCHYKKNGEKKDLTKLSVEDLQVILNDDPSYLETMPQRYLKVLGGFSKIPEVGRGGNGGNVSECLRANLSACIKGEEFVHKVTDRSAWQRKFCLENPSGICGTQHEINKQRGYGSFGKVVNDIRDDEGNIIAETIYDDDDGEHKLVIRASEPGEVWVKGKLEERECSYAVVCRKASIPIDKTRPNKNSAAASAFHGYATTKWDLVGDEYNISGDLDNCAFGKKRGEKRWYHEERIYTGLKQSKYSLMATHPNSTDLENEDAKPAAKPDAKRAAKRTRKSK